MPDCFGNPAPGIPPSISDTFHAISEHRHVPYGLRSEYHYARVAAMVDSDPNVAKRAWDLYWHLQHVRYGQA